MTELIFLSLGIIGGAAVAILLLRRFGSKAPIERMHSQTIFERVQAVGRLVGLEVCAKEIATSTRGWSWLPPLILSQARVAMIFNFEKQYSIDLARLRCEDVEEVGEGRYRVRLPAIEGRLHLSDVTPYDIQAGRVLGLLDIIQVDAPTQKDLMQRAQAQAAELFEKSEPKYAAEAKRSVERQLAALLDLFDVEVEFVWPGNGQTEAPMTSGRQAQPASLG